MRKNLTRHIQALRAVGLEESLTPSESPAQDSPHHCSRGPPTLTMNIVSILRELFTSVWHFYQLHRVGTCLMVMAPAHDEAQLHPVLP